MSAAFDTLSAQKRLLVARSSLNRLHLHCRLAELRLRLPLPRAALAFVPAPAWRRVAFTALLAFAGRERTARALAVASRLLVFSRVSRAAVACARAMGAAHPCVSVQTQTACPPTLELPTRSTP